MKNEKYEKSQIISNEKWKILSTPRNPALNTQYSYSIDTTTEPGIQHPAYQPNEEKREQTGDCAKYESNWELKSFFELI